MIFVRRHYKTYSFTCALGEDGGQSTSHELRGVPPALPLRGGAPARLDPLRLLEVEGVLSSPVLEEDDVRRILTGFVVEL